MKGSITLGWLSIKQNILTSFCFKILKSRWLRYILSFERVLSSYWSKVSLGHLIWVVANLIEDFAHYFKRPKSTIHLRITYYVIVCKSIHMIWCELWASVLYHILLLLIETLEHHIFASKTCVLFAFEDVVLEGFLR